MMDVNLAQHGRDNDTSCVFLDVSVEQLRCACVDPLYRSEWLEGRRPSVDAVVPEVSSPAYAVRFHKLVLALLHALRSGDVDADDSRAALLDHVYRLGAARLVDDLLGSGKTEAAALVASATEAFVDRLLELRELGGRPRRFSEIYAAEPLRLDGVVLETPEGNLSVSGTIDMLRFDPLGRIELVDYRLVRGGEIIRDVVEVALYRKLLLESEPGRPVRGVLEYYLPDLEITPLAEAALDAVYSDVVTPILTEIVACRCPSGT